MSDKPEMYDVKSSQIARIGHAADTLHVEFKNGGTYTYAGVPESTFHNMKSSDSVGGFLHRNVKGKYAHTKLEDSK